MRTMKRRLLLSSTMLVAAAVGYGRRAHAACVSVGVATYQCSGTDTTEQLIFAANAAVSTLPGFNVNTATGRAITISGDGAISYTDTHASPLTAVDTALYVKSAGNDAGTSTPGSVTIATNGTLNSGRGIFARNHGSGTLTITANGDVTGTSAFGIGAYSSVAGTDLSVTTGAGTTVSGLDGIVASNFGSGTLTITANGDVTGTSGRGIYARNFAGTALSVTTGTGTTVSGLYGVFARNQGSGALAITANGDVTGTSREGIDARNDTAGTDLSVTTAARTTASGGTYGILALNNGRGALTITANGDVTGTSRVGIDARNDTAGTDLSVTTAARTTVSGGTYGIRATNKGSGALTITANGDVTGTSGRGIYAVNTYRGSYLGVTTAVGTTVSGLYGIFARNNGSGALAIKAYGNVTGTYSRGIEAFNSAAGSYLSVTTGTGTTVRGGAYGIFARNFGSGALTITANGDVTGTSFSGIDAYSSVAGTDLSVTTAARTTLSGGACGIRAANKGSGALAITANGDVTGTSGRGIYATNAGAGSYVSVTTAASTTVNGGSDGILARNYGSGALTITANGNVTGTSGRGIDAFNSAGSYLGVTTGTGTTVRGGTDGIFARNFGSGALTITANGDVTGTSGRGIYAFNSAAGSYLSVTTGTGTTVRGGLYGIFARNYGSGALTIAANGDVTGTSGHGIFARNYAGTALSVTTAAGTTVRGTASGISARNSGSGALTITSYGNVNVTGPFGRGIYARNSAAGSTLSVTTGAGTTVSAGYGIVAFNSGRGALTIAANGDVTGTSGHGILASNSAAGTDLSVTTAAGTRVSGGTYGILARNSGSGALTITANGDVTGTGTSGAGIDARNLGTGPLTITVGAMSTVTGTGGTAIAAAGGPATVTVAGTVNGGISFDQTTGFANRLDLVTSAVVNGSVRGGSATDTLGLSGSGSGSFNVGQLASFEAGEKTEVGAWTLTGSNAGITTFSVGAGTLNVNGGLGNVGFTVTGGTLAGTGTVGNTSIAGGTFRPGSGTAGSSMTVNGTLGFNAASTYAVNLDPTTASFANVSGTATLGGAAVNASFAPGSYIAKQYTILTAGSISGTFNPTVVNTNLPANFHDTLSYDGTHAYLNLILNFSTPAVGTLNGNQNNVANTLVNFFNTNGGIPIAFATLNAGALGQVSGETGAGVQQTGFAGTNRFMTSVFDTAFGDPGGGAGQGGGAPLGYAPDRKISRAAQEAYAAVTPRDRGTSFDQRWNVWAAAYDGNARIGGDTATGSHATAGRVYGVVSGAGYQLSPATRVGFALGGAGSSFALDGGFGSSRADMFHAALYGRHDFGPAYVAGLVGYTWQDASTDRTVTVAGPDALHASFHPQALSARLETGRRFGAASFTVAPYAAVQTMAFFLPSYAETATSGSNQFALSYAARTVTTTRSELGLRVFSDHAAGAGLLTLRGRLAWAHDSYSGQGANATFQTLPGATFTVSGAQGAPDAALVSLGADYHFARGWAIGTNIDGEFSRTTTSYAAKAAVRYGW